MPRAKIESILKALQETYPQTFPIDSYLILKRGIDLDICKDDKININRTKLRKFLKIYTFNLNYQQVHVIGAKRYDLAGEVVGEVIKERIVSLKKNLELRNKKKEFIQKHAQQEAFLDKNVNRI